MVAPVIGLGRLVLPKALKYAGKAYNAYFYGTTAKQLSEGNTENLEALATGNLVKAKPLVLKAKRYIVTDGSVLDSGKKAVSFKPMRAAVKDKDSQVVFDKQGNVKKTANTERFKYSAGGPKIGGRSVKTVEKNIGGKKVGSINPRTGKQQYSYEGGKTFTIHYDKEGKLASYVKPSAPGSKLGNIKLSGGMLPKYKKEYDALTNKVDVKPRTTTYTTPVPKEEKHLKTEYKQVISTVKSDIEGARVKGDPINTVVYPSGNLGASKIAGLYKKIDPKIRVTSVSKKLTDSRGRPTWAAKVENKSDTFVKPYYSTMDKNYRDAKQTWGDETITGFEKAKRIYKMKVDAAQTNRTMISEAKKGTSIKFDPTGQEHKVMLFTDMRKPKSNITIGASSVARSDINYLNEKIPGKPLKTQLAPISYYRNKLPTHDLSLTKVKIKNKVKGYKLTNPKDILLASNKVKGKNKGARKLFPHTELDIFKDLGKKPPKKPK